MVIFLIKEKKLRRREEFKKEMYIPDRCWGLMSKMSEFSWQILHLNLDEVSGLFGKYSNHVFAFSTSSIGIKWDWCNLIDSSHSSLKFSVESHSLSSRFWSRTNILFRLMTALSLRFYSAWSLLKSWDLGPKTIKIK